MFLKKKFNFLMQQEIFVWYFNNQNHSESILPIPLALSTKGERSSMTEKLKQSQLLESSSRSGKDAIPPHRGCINSTLGQSFEKIYYRNDPVKYDLDLHSHDDTIYSQSCTFPTARTRLTTWPSMRKNLKYLKKKYDAHIMSYLFTKLYN